MSSLFIQAPCSVTLDWEDASSLLASALHTYVDLSLSLEAKYLRVAMTSNLVERIDSKLSSLHSIMEQQLFKSRAAISRTRNRLASPLYRFPEEILSQIFMDVIHDHYPMFEGFSPLSMEDHMTYTYKSLHNLLRVCSVWRNVALRRAALWSTIPILGSPFGSTYSGCRLRQETELSLQRAVGAGLHLAAVLEMSDYEKTKLLPEYIPWFHSINLKSKHLHSIQNLLEMVLDAGIPPSLRELSICHGHNIGCEISERLPHQTDYLTLHECSHRPTFRQLIRSVSILRVSGIPFHWHSIAFSTELVELRIQSVTIGYESELNHFLKAIASAPRLRDLSIISLCAFPDPDESNISMPPFIRLENLKSLYLDDLYFNVLHRILISILSASHRLTLYLNEKCLCVWEIETESGQFEEQDIEYEEMYSLLRRIEVDTLLLYGDFGDHWVTEPVLRQLLCSMLSLKTLRMSHCDFDVENWATLERSSLDFPRLQNLHLTAAKIFDTAGLKKVILSHSIQNLDIGASVWKGDEDSDERE
ncbi:hypothetical protein B0J17DRAFT_224515 [Rhizoctonia solani]|nr:hypothetical protein B0J17DRAFT_224515 [Rhizoctonia solani]